MIEILESDFKKFIPILTYGAAIKSNAINAAIIIMRLKIIIAGK
jgi:hypothetical protein